nr:16S rRNA (cytidine(1402)-2'-O)-methyltransferase [Desulfobacterales bacterium]
MVHADSNTSNSGTLFVVATPIGNLEDITLRAIRTLKDVNLIAAEDTRRTRKILAHFKIDTPIVSFHDHNKESRASDLIRNLKKGAHIALVTDAGTPSVSDPGFYLVRAAVSESIPVVPIPGVSAITAALSISDLPTDSFTFIGFLPRKPKKRRELLEGLKAEPRTLIFYESPYRMLTLLHELFEVMGDRKAILAREMTKLHEEIVRGRLSVLMERLEDGLPLKGECTLLIEGHDRRDDWDIDSIREDFLRLRKKTDLSFSELVNVLARLRGVPRRVVYEEALKIKEGV